MLYGTACMVQSMRKRLEILVPKCKLPKVIPRVNAAVAKTDPRTLRNILFGQVFPPKLTIHAMPVIGGASN